MKTSQIIDQRQDFNTLSDYYSDNEQPNDLDFNEVNKLTKLSDAIKKMQRKCEFLSQNNERLVRRLHYVKRITARKRRDVDMLKARLDVYSDEWRTAQPDPLTKTKLPTNLTPTGKIRKPRLKKNNVASTISSATPETERKIPPPPVDGKLGRRKKTKIEKEKDPNAPKRPANPFFQFCQEQRSILMDELNSGLQPGQPELSKQELTRQLAQRWRSMDPINKQIYVNKYESSKRKYNQEMLTYKKDATPCSSFNFMQK